MGWPVPGWAGVLVRAVICLGTEEERKPNQSRVVAASVWLAISPFPPHPPFPDSGDPPT